VDSELPVGQRMSMPAMIERQKGGDPFFVKCAGELRASSTDLAAIGVYGLIAYSVASEHMKLAYAWRWTRSSDRAAYRLAEGMKMTGIGAAIGLALGCRAEVFLTLCSHGLHLREPRLYFIVPAAIFMMQY